ncbi:MAG TPA: class I SAM-dependent methyltransferase [Thermoanaerobaculia bacterium]|nr:class I SAM-dependent methyltransferase [Thermoanaerobaculia bacterium]
MTARLFGLEPAPPERCRVLEVGCGAGAHLVALAFQLPASRFLGIDPSRRQLAAARRLASGLALDNLELRQAGVEEVGDEVGEVDYLIAHGVYSWVEPAARDALLALCRRCLAPHGVAYLSYNTYPGWALRGTVREMLRLLAPTAGGPESEEAAATALLRFLAENSRADEPLGSFLRNEYETVRRMPAGYLFHDHLAPLNQPVWFHELVAHAARHHLQYLGESRLGDMAAERFPAATRDALEAIADDLVTSQQLMDCLQPRYLRRSLLCHRDRRLQRHVGWRAVTSLRVAFADAGLAAPPQGLGIAEEAPEAPAARAAAEVLAARAPQSTAFATLLREVRRRLGGEADRRLRERLARIVLSAHAGGWLQLLPRRWDLAVAPARRPRASALARRQAASAAGSVTSQRHEVVPMGALDRLLLPLLDGRRTRPALRRDLAAAGRAVSREELEARLQAYARWGLLVPGSPAPSGGSKMGAPESEA